MDNTHSDISHPNTMFHFVLTCHADLPSSHLKISMLHCLNCAEDRGRGLSVTCLSPEILPVGASGFPEGSPFMFPGCVLKAEEEI